MNWLNGVCINTYGNGAKIIITAGIGRVVHGGVKGLSDYWIKSHQIAQELFHQACVEVVEIKDWKEIYESYRKASTKSAEKKTSQRTK